MTYTHKMQLHESNIDFLPADRRQALQEILATDLGEMDRPFAIHQQAAYVENDLISVKDFGALYWRGSRLVRATLGTADADHQQRLALLGADLSVDGTLMTAIRGAIAQEYMRRDEYMQEAKVFNIYHMPRAIVVSWQMDTLRIKRYIDHTLGRTGIGCQNRSHPPGALGTMITKTAANRHEELKLAAARQDAFARYQRVISDQKERLFAISPPSQVKGPVPA